MKKLLMTVVLCIATAALGMNLTACNQVKKDSMFSDSSRQRRMESPTQVNDYVRVTSVSPFLIGYNTEES